MNDEYRLNSDGSCEHCGWYGYCQRCAFNISLDYADSYCKECHEGFYLDSEDHNHCKKCKEPIEISNGYCRVCSDFEGINIILKRAILIVFHVQKSVLIVNIITKRIRLNA